MKSTRNQRSTLGTAERVATAVALPLVVGICGGVMGGGLGAALLFLVEADNQSTLLEFFAGGLLVGVLGAFHGVGPGVLCGVATIPLVRILPKRSIAVSTIAAGAGAGAAALTIVALDVANIWSEFERPFVVTRVAASAVSVGLAIWTCGRAVETTVK